MRLHHIPLLLIGFVAGAACAQLPGRLEIPEVQAGDAWTYENTVFPSETKRRLTVRVRAVTPESILTGDASSGSVFTRHWALVETKRANEVTYRANPGRALLQFPLEVGKRWDANLDATLADGWVQRWRQTQARVEKIEKVIVPAGAFEAYLVRFEGYYSLRNGQNLRWVESIWYSPEVRRWVKRDWQWNHSAGHFGTIAERQLEELVSFTRGNTAQALPEALKD